MPQSTQQPPNTTVGEIIRGLFQGVCLTIDLCLHHSIGSNYVMSGFAGVIVLALTACNFPPAARHPLVCFTYGYTAMWLIAMFASWIRIWRGRDRLHSGYTGKPYLSWLLPRWREDYLKQVEAILVILIGFGLCAFNPPLGGYLMVAASLVFVRGLVLLARRRHQVTVMSDLVIEQRMTAEQLDGMR